MDLPFTMARRKRLTVLANEDGRAPEASRKELPAPDPARGGLHRHGARREPIEASRALPRVFLTKRRAFASGAGQRHALPLRRPTIAQRDGSRTQPRSEYEVGSDRSVIERLEKGGAEPALE